MTQTEHNERLLQPEAMTKNMRVEYEPTEYVLKRNPFTLKDEAEDFLVFELMFNSVTKEDVIIFAPSGSTRDLSPEEILEQQQNHLRMILKEYVFEDDEALTLNAQEYKINVKRFFGIQ